MSRNSSGTYTLPVADQATGNTITATIWNSNFDDLATAMTQSLATTGVSTMTGPIVASAGSLAAPSYTFSGDTGTGFYLAGSHQIGIAANGSSVGSFNSNLSVTWAGAASWAGAGTFSTTLGVTGATTLSSTASIAGKLSLTSTDSMAMANGTTGQRNGSPSAGDTRYNSTLNRLEYWNGTGWLSVGADPTYQVLTSGSGTYTAPSGVWRIKVRMCGGGGGGGAAQTNAGANGNTSSFGAWTAVFGSAGGAGGGIGGAGGSGGTNGTGTLILRLSGGVGGAGGVLTAGGTSAAGGSGGVNPFGGNGGGGLSIQATNGVANTGAGGGGGSTTASTAGGGGGAGEYVEFMVTGGITTAAYTVGAGGGGGAAGSHAGGNGGSGVIIVEEFYS